MVKECKRRMQSLPHSTTPYNVSLMDFIPLLILWFCSIPGKTLITWNQTPKWGEKDKYPAGRGFSLAWHLALTKSFAWLVGCVKKPTTRQTSHANDFVNAKSHVNGRFRQYDFCLRTQLAYVKTFDHHHAHNLHLRHQKCVVRMLWF